VKAKRLAENYDVEIHKLPADLQQQQKHNMHLMDLTQGLIVHPEERACYEQQLHAADNQLPMPMVADTIST